MTTISSRRSRAARRSITTAAAVTAVALALAACGGTSDTSGTSGSPYAASGTPGPAAGTSSGTPVALASSNLGKILVDGQGRTLYLFEADKGATSTCNGACASAWPPLTTSGKPTAVAGVSRAKLGTTKRDDGQSQITYNGHPLYTYAGDGAPGQTTGEGLDQFGAEWYALSRAGNSIKADG